MSMLSELRERLKALVLRDRAEAEMAAEMRFHVEMEATKLREEGLSADAAYREALRRFGGRSRFEEEVRDERGMRLLEDLLQDLRYGARTLRRNAGLSAVLVVTLAVGIGATTAVFSVVHGVLLKPLPYPESDRLVMLREVERNGLPNWVAHPNFVDWREQATRSFEAVASVEWPAAVTVLGAAEPLRVMAMGVSREFFDVARVWPTIGRAISAEENRVGGAPTVVVSRGFWEQHLGGDTNLAAHTLQFNGEAFQVVGVMPAGFRLLGDVALWFPYERTPNNNRMSHAYRVLGRLGPGVTLAAARSEMTALSQLLLEEYDANTRAVDVYVNTLHDEAVSGSRGSLYMLLGAAALLLLVACTNIASTLLARGMAREQELAVRASMGAGRLRLVRQLFTESLVITAGGVALGVALAALLVRVFTAIGAGRVPRIAEVSLSPGVLAFSIALSLVSAVLFGLLPAIRLADREVSAQLRSGSRGSTGAGRQVLWRSLVGAEIAMATMLLIGAGLLIRSLWTILQIDIGYRTDDVLVASVSLPPASYAEPAQIRTFYDQLLPELAALQGVRTIGMVSHLPIAWGSYTANATPRSADGPGDGDGAGAVPNVGWRVINRDYFDALGMRVLRGRGFTDADIDGALPVVIVNEPLAHSLWPGEDPIGRQVRSGFDPRGEWLTVVGVVNQARNWQAAEQLELYVPYAQRPESARSMSVLIATTGPTAALGPAVRERLRAVDANVPVELAQLARIVSGTTAGPRFTMTVLASFAAAALLLAVIGVYGVMSYAVARRQREIGVRLALGATPGAVHRLIQSGALRVALAGVVAGGAGALAFGRVMRSMLYEVRANDPATFVAAILILLVAALTASWVPARRSTRVDPMITMRAD